MGPLPSPEPRPARPSLPRDELAAVLAANDRGAYTVPSPGLYPYQWLWDSAFAALGWAAVDPQRAADEIDSVLTGQWPDGGLPHIVFQDPSPDYLPGPAVWSRRSITGVAVSGISQPPVLATVARLLVDRHPALASRARSWLAPLEGYSAWLAARTVDGLPVCLHPWETGADNSPAWDIPLAAVEPTGLEPYQRKDTEFVDPAFRPSDEDYDRYMSLVFSGRRAGWDDSVLTHTSRFRVIDPAFASIAARADADLADLADLLGHPSNVVRRRAERTRSALAGLWDDDTGWFLARDLLTDRPIPVPTWAGAMPLWAGAATPAQATRIAARLGRWATQVAYLVPTVDPDHPSFDPRRYWRGPVWVNVNWLIASGLAGAGHPDLATRVWDDALRLVATGCHEYFDPTTGQGVGGGSFTWSAALPLWGALAPPA